MAESSDLQSTKDLAFCDVERELAATRRVLERVPEEHFQWKPHEKSMTLQQLAGHVATMPIWCVLTLEQDGPNFTSPPHIPRDFSGREALLKISSSLVGVGSGRHAVTAVCGRGVRSCLVGSFS